MSALIDHPCDNYLASQHDKWLGRTALLAHERPTEELRVIRLTDRNLSVLSEALQEAEEFGDKVPESSVLDVAREIIRGLTPLAKSQILASLDSYGGVTFNIDIPKHNARLVAYLRNDMSGRIIIMKSSGQILVDEQVK